MSLTRRQAQNAALSTALGMGASYIPQVVNYLQQPVVQESIRQISREIRRSRRSGRLRRPAPRRQTKPSRGSKVITKAGPFPATSNGMQLQMPLKISRNMAFGQPKISHNKGGGCTISHVEYIQDIQSSVDFNVNTFPIQPGVAKLFPWLSTISQRFEFYKFRSLSVRLENLTGSSATGTVITSVDLDATDPAPVNKSEALQALNSARSAAWTPSQLTVKPEGLVKKLYIRHGTVPNTDLKTYDVGNLYICTEGQADSTTPLMELRIAYTIDFFVPQYTFIAPSYFIESDTTPVAKATPFANPPAKELDTGLGIERISGGAQQGKIRFTRSGDYYVTIYTVGASAAVTDCSVTLTGGGTVQTIGAIHDISSFAWNKQVVVKVTKSGSYIDVAFTSSGANVIATNLRITPGIYADLNL